MLDDNRERGPKFTRKRLQCAHAQGVGSVLRIRLVGHGVWCKPVNGPADALETKGPSRPDKPDGTAEAARNGYSSADTLEEALRNPLGDLLAKPGALCVRRHKVDSEVHTRHDRVACDIGKRLYSREAPLPSPFGRANLTLSFPKYSRAA